MGIDPVDDRIPIGPTDVISMHRRRAVLAQAVVRVPNQPVINALHVIVRDWMKSIRSHVDGKFKQFVALVVARRAGRRRLQLFHVLSPHRCLGVAG